jgi:hypothetical protein
VKTFLGAIWILEDPRSFFFSIYQNLFEICTAPREVFTYQNFEYLIDSKNNENVTKITIFFVKIVTNENLRKTYEKITEFKTKIK